MKKITLIKSVTAILIIGFVWAFIPMSLTQNESSVIGNTAYARSIAGAPNTPAPAPDNEVTTKYYCGDISYKAYTSIDLGCEHHGNPIMALVFAIVKFLSDGVGLVVIASLIIGGIQFTTSRGDPQSTAIAIKRLRSNIGALMLFLFAYVILNYIVPGAILQ
jgi:hypothetical protein